MMGDKSPNGRNRIPDTRPTRRQFLAVAGGTFVGLSAVSTAQQTTTTVQPREAFRFGGQVQAWEGRAPQSISGQQNPTLQLQAGQVYEVTWENIDGQPHNFQLQDENGQGLPVIFPDVQTNTGGGNQTTTTTTTGTQTTTGDTVTPPEDAIRVTENLSQQGATQTLRFVATQDVAQYICTIHPTTMIGEVNLQNGDGNGGGGGGNVGGDSGGGDGGGGNGGNDGGGGSGGGNGGGGGN